MLLLPQLRLLGAIPEIHTSSGTSNTFQRLRINGDHPKSGQQHFDLMSFRFS